MSKYRKKYQNIVEKKNHLTYVPRDHNTIEHYESQALDGFTVEPSEPEFYMQRMGQLHIKSSGKKRYLNYYSRQMRLLFPAAIRKYALVQTLDNFIIKPKEKPKNAIQKPVNFIISRNIQPKNYVEEQIDSFICAKKPRPLLNYENVYNVTIEKEKKRYFTQSLNQIKLPATGKRFNNNPILRPRGNIEMEYLKIAAPYKCIHSSNLLLPLKPKKTRFTDIIAENNSNFTYLLKKKKIFSPASTIIKNHSSLLIPNQPKKTSFKEISTEKALDLVYDGSPQARNFDYITIENFPDIYIQEQPKKRYYSVMNADNMSIVGSERPEFCLEIDPNEEIFIPNVYDMLLIQNYWDNLSIKSFRICLRPKGYIGRSSQNVGNYDYNDLLAKIKNVKTEAINENNEENEIEIELDKEIVKDFNIEEEKKGNEKDEMEINLNENNIYENRESVTSLKADLEDKDKDKDKVKDDRRPKKSSLKRSRFKDLKKIMMIKNNDDDE